VSEVVQTEGSEFREDSLGGVDRLVAQFARPDVVENPRRRLVVLVVLVGPRVERPGVDE